jgi:hypothetical protein
MPAPSEIRILALGAFPEVTPGMDLPPLILAAAANRAEIMIYRSPGTAFDLDTPGDLADLPAGSPLRATTRPT